MTTIFITNMRFSSQIMNISDLIVALIDSFLMQFILISDLQNPV